MSYLHNQILDSETAPHIVMMTDTSREICAEGPARTSKTLRNLRKLLALHFQYKGFMSCVVRTNSVDLDDTIRYDLRNTLLKYQLDDPRSPISQSGGPTRFHTLRINGGEMRLGGMNRPGSILGTEYDAILLSELSQFTEDQYQMLKTRCSGSAGNWRLPNGDVMSQVVCDTNPDVPDHFMYQRETEGLIKFVKFGFADNPAFYRNGRWSDKGKNTVNELDRSLTGIFHDRYFKGLRRAPEGMVFELMPDDIIEELPDLSGFVHYNCMDFGMSAPSVCLWIAENPHTEEVVVYREWRHTRKTSIEMGNEVRVLRETNGERILGTVIDNDEEKKKLLATHCGIDSDLTVKGPGSVFHRTVLVQNALKEKKLKFYRHLRFNVDPELIRNKKPLDVISEIRLAHYPPNPKSDSAPVKSDDHGIDALGYWFLWRESRRGGGFGFAAGGAKRKRRDLF